MPHGGGPVDFALHALTAPTFWVALAGVVTAWLFFLRRPQLAEAAARHWSLLRRVLVNKYYFDWFNENVVCVLARGLGKGLWRAGDEILIDVGMVNGTVALVTPVAGLVCEPFRYFQSRYAESAPPESAQAAAVAVTK